MTLTLLFQPKSNIPTSLDRLNLTKRAYHHFTMYLHIFLSLQGQK